MSDATYPELSPEERADIEALWARRLTSTHYQLLGVPRNADRKTIRDAYFSLSRRFHPDVFYKRNLGEYRTRIEEVFRMLTRAYDVLSNSKQRAGYDLHLNSLESQPPPADTQRPPGMEEEAARVSIPQPAPLPTPDPPRPTMSADARIGAVVPPPVRAASAAPTSGGAQGSSQPIDPAIRQRAMEAMRRRLSSVVSPPQRTSNPGTPAYVPAPQAAPRLDDREAKLARVISEAEEAQKVGNFEKALECFRAAQQLAKDDEGLRARADAVDQLVKAQKTGEHIEKARDAMREGKAELAATLWEKAWEGRPTDAGLLVNAAEVLAKYGSNRGKAKELAQRALAVDPSAVKAHIVLANIFAAAGLKASARAAIDAIAKLDPENAALKELREKVGPMSLAEQLGLRGR